MKLATRAKQESPHISFEARVAARRWAESEPALKDLMSKGAFERRRRKDDGEGREPRSVIYHH